MQGYTNLQFKLGDIIKLKFAREHIGTVTKVFDEHYQITWIDKRISKLTWYDNDLELLTPLEREML